MAVLRATAAESSSAAATKMRSSTLLTLCLCGYAAAFTSRTPRPTIAHHRLAAMRSTAPLICSESGEAVDDRSYTRLLSVLAAGDAAALVVFAAIGRGNHDSSTGNALTTAAPFLLSWAALAPPLGAYSTGARSLADAAKTPLLAWAAAVPCGCALRGLLQQRMPAAPFWIVAMIATAVLLEAWRLAHYQVLATDAALDEFVSAIVDDDD